MAERIVEVVWLDALHQFHQMSVEGIEPGMRVTTVGYVVKRDKDFLSLAMEKLDDQYRNIMTIPRVLVKRVRYVER